MSDSPLYYLPNETAQQVQKYCKNCKNLALILDKYVASEVIDKRDTKRPWLQGLIQPPAIDAELARNAYLRWRAMMKSLGVTPFEGTIDWRMVVGLGGETVLETDITLHALYGIPFIPGSALKGLTRAYVASEENEYFVPGKKSDKLEASKEAKTDHPRVQRVFGKETDKGTEAGTVIFYDALPVNGVATFVIDIMNPHYPKYYETLKSNSITPPANDQSPVPITFLTVTNTIFAFALAPRNPNEPEHTEDVVLATQWLRKALQHYGVGGKTSAGYGYFTFPEQKTAAAPLSEVKQPEPIPYVRPRIPNFIAGQSISECYVIASTDELRRRVPEAKVFLRYHEFPLKDVLIAVETEDELSWTHGQRRNCLFMREEEREGCTVLICRPGVDNKKKKGKQ